MGEITEMTAMSALKLMPSKKEEVKNFASQIKEMLMSGNIHPLELLSSLKAIEKTVKDILGDKDIKGEFLRSMQGDKKRESYGCLFEESEAGVKYDYTGCNQWNEISEQINELSEQKKAIEEMLKKSSSRVPYIDPTTGEEIKGVGKKSETIVKVTLK